MYGSHISVLVHCNGVYIKCNIVTNVFFNPIRTVKKNYHRYLIRAKQMTS